VGDLSQASDQIRAYDAVGRECYEQLLAALPEDFDLPGKRVLDFGCGAGRTLRHLVADGTGAELWGCDVDVASIEWLTEHADDQVRAFPVAEEPGLPVPDGQFDLIYAFSVFTHLSQRWAGWMLELRRALSEHGLLFVTFLGPDCASRLAGEVCAEDQVGMVVLGEGAPWDEGGPFTVHAPWWLRAHWGRAFEVLSLEQSVLDMGDGFRQGFVLMRNKSGDPSIDDLERPERSDPRELEALWFGQKVVMRHDANLRSSLEGRIAELQRELAVRGQALETVYSSKSWRLTAPLRALLEERRARHRT
jgi:SAM-dependent methyltransferase